MFEGGDSARPFLASLPEAIPEAMWESRGRRLEGSVEGGNTRLPEGRAELSRTLFRSLGVACPGTVKEFESGMGQCIPAVAAQGRVAPEVETLPARR